MEVLLVAKIGKCHVYVDHIEACLPFLVVSWSKLDPNSLFATLALWVNTGTFK